jgi:hypothetical protein
MERWGWVWWRREGEGGLFCLLCKAKSREKKFTKVTN